MWVGEKGSVQTFVQTFTVGAVPAESSPRNGLLDGQRTVALLRNLSSAKQRPTTVTNGQTTPPALLDQPTAKLLQRTPPYPIVVLATQLDQTMQGRKAAVDAAASATGSAVNTSLWGQYLVNFLTGNFPFSGELQSFWMAIQGCMAIRALQESQQRKLHWFHAFTLSVIAGYAGGWFGFFLMAKPSAMFANDLNMGSCILAFVLVNYTPFDLGYTLCRTLPVTVITTSFAQLFRSVAIPKFVHVCFETFRSNPSPYYPIPVFGPIMYATLLGNMGGFLTKGLEGHVKDGMPWPVQNGIFCASLYHFYVNDATGPIGMALRQCLAPLAAKFGGGLDNATFGVCFVSLFMQIVGILQLPRFLGPSFSPFASLGYWIGLGMERPTIEAAATTATQAKEVKKKSSLSSSNHKSSSSSSKKRNGSIPAVDVTTANGGDNDRSSDPLPAEPSLSPTASLKKRRKRSRKSKSKEE